MVAALPAIISETKQEEREKGRAGKGICHLSQLHLKAFPKVPLDNFCLFLICHPSWQRRLRSVDIQLSTVSLRKTIGN